ncbi:hypothetical protein [Hamadaea tsunoensis]|uniref:hypothetical protein n=1 Tax=Hamadaea tsunoensis TaxID=53368 RepID=UPI000424FF5D|nr:hypothetical protein [Hamadaea tsunoensis]
MRAATLLRLAFAGSWTDGVRAALTVVAAFLAGLAILAVGVVTNMAPTTAILPDGDGLPQEYPTSYRYTSQLLNEPGLRPGLIIMVAALAIPALFLIAQAARLGGPARDRRLAALRIAGAAPQQVRWIAGAEQGFAVAAGAVLAAVAYPGVRALLDRPVNDPRYLVSAVAYHDGKVVQEIPYFAGPWRPLPTDTAPSWWSWVLLLALPVLAALLSLYALRGVIAEPLAASRAARRTRPRWWPVWALGAGLAGLALCRGWLTALRSDPVEGREPLSTVLPHVGSGLSVAAIVVAVPFCAAAIGHVCARVTARYARRPAPLLAARRVLADPYSGSRAVSVLLVAALMVAVFTGVRAQFAFDNEIGALSNTSHGDPQLDRTVFGLLDGLVQVFLWIGAAGLLIALTDRALTRRRTDAAATAAGVSVTTLAKASVGTVLLTAIPGVLLGLAVGTAVPYLALDPVQKPDSIEYTCYAHQSSSSATDPPEVPCTPAGIAAHIALQKCASNGGGPCPDAPYSWVNARTQGPWHAVYPAVEWLSLLRYAGLALLAVALATALSLVIGRRSPAATALRTT